MPNIWESDSDNGGDLKELFHPLLAKPDLFIALLASTF